MFFIFTDWIKELIINLIWNDMGKSAKLKKIRRLVATMPAVSINKTFREVLTGRELVNDGIDSVKGESIKAGGRYIKSSVKPAPLDHEKQMKRIYSKHGMAGVVGYMDAIDNHVKNSANAK